MMSHNLTTNKEADPMSEKIIHLNEGAIKYFASIEPRKLGHGNVGN